MFTELAPLLKKGDTLVLNVSREADDRLRVSVIPKLFTMDGQIGDDHKALNVPVVITATPAELDSPEFVATLNRYTASTTGLRQTIDDVEAAHKFAATAKLAKKSTPKPAPKAETTATDEAAGEEPEPEAPKPAPKPKVTEPSESPQPLL